MLSLKFPLKFKNFVVAGVVAAASLNSFSDSIISEDLRDFENRVVAMQNEGVLTKVPISYNVKPKAELKGVKLIAWADIDLVYKTCKIFVNISKENLEISFNNDSNPVSGLSRAKVNKFNLEFATLHESAHCKLFGMKDVYRTGNKEFDVVLNDLFSLSAIGRDSKTNKKIFGLYNILHENYADVLSAILMIKSYGASKDVLSALHGIQVERSETALARNKEGGFDLHSTGIALEKILEPKNIKRILEAKNMNELQELALTVGNEGMWKSIKTHKGDIGNFLNDAEVVEAIGFLSLKILKREVFNLAEVAPSTASIDVSVFDSNIYRLAKGVADEIMGLRDIKSNRIVEGEEVYRISFKKFEDFIKSTVDKNGLSVTDRIAKYLDKTVKPEEVLGFGEYAEIGAKRVAAINDSRDSWLPDKLSALDNIFEIRSGSSTSKAFSFNIK